MHDAGLFYLEGSANRPCDWSTGGSGGSSRSDSCCHGFKHILSRSDLEINNISTYWKQYVPLTTTAAKSCWGKQYIFHCNPPETARDCNSLKYYMCSFWLGLPKDQLCKSLRAALFLHLRYRWEAYRGVQWAKPLLAWPWHQLQTSAPSKYNSCDRARKRKLNIS